METLLQDLRYGARVLMKKPGFSLIAVITLALGIGANAAIFSVTDKLLIRSLHVKEPQRLVLINSVSVSPYFVSNLFSYPDFNDYRAQNEVLSGLLTFIKTQLELNTKDQIERVESEYVSANYFAQFGSCPPRHEGRSDDRAEVRIGSDLGFRVRGSGLEERTLNAEL